jgi:hypothetical protein
VSVPNARERLQAAWENLQTAWEAARNVWRDEVALQFERKFWMETESTVEDVLRRLDDLEDAVAAVP